MYILSVQFKELTNRYTQIRVLLLLMEEQELDIHLSNLAFTRAFLRGLRHRTEEALAGPPPRSTCRWFEPYPGKWMWYCPTCKGGTQLETDRPCTKADFWEDLEAKGTINQRREVPKGKPVRKANQQPVKKEGKKGPPDKDRTFSKDPHKQVPPTADVDANPYAAGAASCTAPNPYAQSTHIVQQIPTASAKTNRDSKKTKGSRQPGTWSAPTVGNKKEEEWQTAQTAKYPPKLSAALAIAISESAYLPSSSSTLPAPD